MCSNTRDALPGACYEQLKNSPMSYREVSIRDYFDHLDKHRSKIDTKTIKSTTKLFYEPWNQLMHVMKFAKHLDQQQECLQSAGIEITNASKLQFYTDQIIYSQMFDNQLLSDE